VGRRSLEHRRSTRQVIWMVEGYNILPQDLIGCVAEPIQNDRIGEPAEVVLGQDQDDVGGVRNQRSRHPFTPRERRFVCGIWHDYLHESLR
jgi:hypothetical protein